MHIQIPVKAKALTQKVEISKFVKASDVYVEECSRLKREENGTVHQECEPPTKPVGSYSLWEMRNFFSWLLIYCVYF